MIKTKEIKAQTPTNAPQQPSKLARLIKYPKWAWVVSGLPGVNINAVQSRYQRWALYIALKTRKIYYPFMSVRVIFITLVAFMLCYFIPQRHTGLLHFFAIASSPAAIQVLTVIIGSLSAILAIVFSIVLVAVGIVRNYSYRGKISSIFTYYPLRELLLFYGTVIATSIFVLATVNEPLSLRSIHLIYLEIYFFLVAVIAIYPAIRDLLDTTDPVSSVPRRIKEIKKSVAQLGRFSITGDSEVVPAKVAHPIFILRDIAIKALSENNEVTAIQIINQMSQRLRELVKEETDPQNRRSIIDSFLLVWRSLMLRAVRLESEGVLLCLIEALRDINASISKGEYEWFETLELNQFHLELISKAVETGYVEVATRGIYLLGHCFEWNIPNIPPAKELFTFVSRKEQGTFTSDTSKELKWEHLTSDLIRLLGSSASEAIKYNSEAVARDAISNLSSLIQKVNGAKQLSDRQKGIIIAQISWTIRENLISGLKRLTIPQVFLFIPRVDDYEYRDLLTSNKEYSKFPIIFYKEIFREAIKQKQLSGYTLDSFRMATFSLTKKLKEGRFDRVKKIQLFLVAVLDDVRAQTDGKTSEQSRECYLAAYDKLKAMQKIVTELNDNEINNAIEGSLRKFNNITELRKMQNNYDELW